MINMNNGVNALPIIGSFYIKESKLLEMTSYAFTGSNATSVNIYIDLNSVFNKLFTPSFNMESRLNDYEIASTVLNMIAHYRYFFWSKLKVNTKFYFVYSLLNNNSIKIYYPNYNSNTAYNIVFNKDKYDLINKNISLLEKIIPYIPDSCITIGTVEPCVTMKWIIENNKDPNPNILLTKDEVTMQLSAVINNTVVYVPKKYKGEDSSYVIIPTNNGLYNALSDKRKCKKYEFSIEMNSGLYSFILSVIGVKSRNMNSIISYTSCIKELEKLIINNKINNSYNSIISNIYNEMNSKYKVALINSNIDGRFKALDLLYQYGIYLNNPERLYYKGIQNLYDPNGVHQICDEYFKECPINLERM